MTDSTNRSATGSENSAGPSDQSALWQQAAAHFERYRGGDAQGMDDLVRLLTPVLWHVVRAYGLDPSRAEDVVQSTWLTLVRRHESIQQPRAVSSWVIVTARREAWRAARGDRTVTPTDDEVLASKVPRAESAETQAVLNDSQRRLWLAVDALNERCRRLLRVIAFDERPDYEGLAQELEMPVGSIGPTRGRCLTKLRDALRDQGETR